jgi:O-antigen/teichoic acid export membrane protein
VIIKFIAASKTDSEVAGYLRWFIKPVFILSILLALGTAISAPFLAKYLNTPHTWGILIIAVSFLFGLPSYLFRSVLQGLIKFHLVVTSLISETALKLLAALIFIWIGWGVMGAMTGLLVAIIAGCLISYFFLKNYFSVAPATHLDKKGVISFTMPVLIQTIAMTSLMSVDLILVKHFFSSFDAGVYAAVATMGKIILFASAPVATVMFPLITKKYSLNENFTPIFFLSLFATVLVVTSVIMIYYFFPYFAMGMLYGDKYFSGISLLVPYALYTGLLSLVGLYTNLYMSINHNKVMILPLLAAVAQFGVINLLHNSIAEVVWISVVVAALLFGLLSVYFLTVVYSKKNEKNKS